jgi:hypothetical protein
MTMMRNRIYTVYEYKLRCSDENGNAGRYFMDLYEVKGKIELSVEQFKEIIENAAKNGYCRKTDVSSPTEVPFSEKCDWLRMYVIG